MCDVNLGGASDIAVVTTEVKPLVVLGRGVGRGVLGDTLRMARARRGEGNPG